MIDDTIRNVLCIYNFFVFFTFFLPFFYLFFFYFPLWFIFVHLMESFELFFDLTLVAGLYKKRGFTSCDES
jgi:hypothetical protein